MRSRRAWSSDAWLLASFTIRSTSSFDRPLAPLMVIFCSLPVAMSFAATLTMPLASMSKETSTCGTPRGAGGSPTSWNLPSVRVSRASGRSPSSTWTSTLVCVSQAADQDDFVDLSGLDAGVRKRLLDGRHGPLQQVVDQLFELRTRQFDLQMPRPTRVGGDKRQVDVGFHRRGQLDLGFLRAFLQTL